MIEVLVVAEGQTEQTFVANLLAPAFRERETYLYPRLISTSKHGRGGALSIDRVLADLRKALRERTDTYVTTFFDLYRLHRDFPGVAESSRISDPLQRSTLIESKLAEAVVAQAKCRADRFLPHIQPYEFESLLFSDVTRFSEIRSEWKTFEPHLEAARVSAATPEHINEGPDTHPSARLAKLVPRYKKVLYGSAIAARIGLNRLRAECLHFGDWLARLEALQPLRLDA